MSPVNTGVLLDWLHYIFFLSIAGWKDFVALSVYLVYQYLFLVIPLQFIFDLPPGSAVVCTTEQVSLFPDLWYTKSFPFWQGSIKF